MQHVWYRRVFGGKARRKEIIRLDLDVGGRIILRWISEKEYGAVWNGFIWLRIRTNGGLL
jgi:hypothetical protein